MRSRLSCSKGLTSSQAAVSPHQHCTGEEQRCRWCCCGPRLGCTASEQGHICSQALTALAPLSARRRLDPPCKRTQAPEGHGVGGPQMPQDVSAGGCVSL